jgi:hypothetical protein
MHYEDAIRFLIEKLGANPNIFVLVPPNFDIWIPHAVVAVLQYPSNQRKPRGRGDLARTARESGIFETGWRSEVNSNCRYRFVNSQTTA